MGWDHLRDVIVTIVNKAVRLKGKYIQEPLGSVDYVAIFPKSNEERTQYLDLMGALSAKVVYTDHDGPLYHLPKAIQTDYGSIDFIKICNVDSIYNPKRDQIGYVDYQTSGYNLLKDKYGKNPAFSFLYGKGWEILCLANPDEDVSVYIPNIPLSKDLGF
ncbi:MAG TPA: hypothetical protein VMR81_02775 [Patescibacteria group bacterium]|nr:hypothetical protein [Patescibacteria group bacterium]